VTTRDGAGMLSTSFGRTGITCASSMVSSSGMCSRAERVSAMDGQLVLVQLDPKATVKCLREGNAVKEVVH